MNQNQVTNYEHLDTQYGQYCIIDEDSDESPIHRPKKCKLSDADIKQDDTPDRNKKYELPAPVIRVLWMFGTVCVAGVMCAVVFMYSNPFW